MTRTTRLLLLCCALATGAPAFADDLLGIYVGAGVSRSDLRQDYYQIDAHATGWKLLAGWRPISLLGVEAEYTDLGSKGVNTYADSTHVSTDATATAAYVLGYLPVPLPWIDVYGKLGAARVKANTSAYPTGVSPPACLPGDICAPSTPVSNDNSKTSVAWGAGLQFKWGHWATRLDYERFDGSQGDPAALAAEFLFNF
jgi:opacity protein-like surface antigen